MPVFSFKKVGIEWAVFTAEGARLGRARANGSRIRERSWTWKSVSGAEGRSSSRKNAAESMARAEQKEN